MKVVLNRSGILWAVGILQPVSALELAAYFEDVLGDSGQTPSGPDLHKFLMDAVSQDHLVRVFRDPDLFSLSILGNSYLNERQRKSRDISRIFLLRDSLANRRYLSRDDHALGLGDDASPVDASSLLKGSETNASGLSVPQARPHWPRYSKQLIETGLLPTSRDTFLNLLSFDNTTQLRVALRRLEAQPTYDFVTIGTMLGISPKLIQRIIRNKSRYYRSFELTKRSGGKRLIQSPRVFLKIIQKFLADYVFCDLQIHSSVHSYRKDYSIISNASVHAGKKYVANIDIKNFFGSISEKLVQNFLISRGFGTASAFIIAALVTKDGTLPQGSPASPVISNAILHSFDNKISEKCRMDDLEYSRYADDITISGNEATKVSALLPYISDILASEYGLELNKEKCRIATFNAQQKVTGLVVNEFVQPSRKYRRGVRAGVNNLAKSTVPSIDEFNRISGAVGYLNSFPHMRGTYNIVKLTNKLSEISRTGTPGKLAP